MSKDILDKLAEEVDKIESSEAEEVTQNNPTVKTEVSPMEKLLAENPVEIPEVGDVVEGTIIDVSSNSALIDLGSLGTGIVLGKEMKSGIGSSDKVKPGDKVTATLTDLENEDGFIELSIREASYEKAWDDIEDKQSNEDTVNVKVMDANKGGLMTEVNGITGFLPVSQLSSEHYPRVEDGDKNKILELLKKLIGTEVTVKLIDADRESEKLIVSEKAALSEKEREIISDLQIGDVVEGEISGVVDFGAFIKFVPQGQMSESTPEAEKLEGLVHISELAWQLIDDPKEIIKVGDKVQAKIIGIDDTRISLSIRALSQDPWETVTEKYKIGEVYEGKVDKINHFGAFVYLDPNIHGLAHISEFQEVYPEKKMEDMLEPGNTYKWKILSIEPKDHRMGLMLVADEK